MIRERTIHLFQRLLTVALVAFAFACSSVAHADIQFNKGFVVGQSAFSLFISGTNQVGNVLSVPNYPGATYQWVRTASGTSTPISGATSNTYTIQSADEGTTLSVQVSYALGSNTPTPPTTCPLGQAWTDGCASANANAQVIFPTLLTTAPTNGYTTSSGARQSLDLASWTSGGTTCSLCNPQTYTATVPWNKPGIDYPVGITVPESSLADPLLPAGCTPGGATNCTSTNIPGCTYHNTGYPSSSYTGYYVSCLSTAGVWNLTGYDMSLHGCVPLLITHSTSTTQVNISNMYFGWGPNCAIHNPSNAYVLQIQSGTSPVNFTNISVEGNALVPNGCASGVTCAGCVNSTACSLPSVMIHINETVTATVEYSSFTNIPARPISSPNNGDMYIRHTLFYGFSYQGSGLHGESASTQWTPGLTQNNIYYDYDVVVLPANAVGNGPGSIIAGNLNDNPPTTSLSMVNNVYVGHSVIINNLQDGTNQNCDSGDQVCVRSHTTDSSAFNLMGSNYGTITLDHDYIDPTGSYYCFSYNSGASAPPSPATTTFIGNVNLLTNEAITYYSGQNQFGCTGAQT